MWSSRLIEICKAPGLVGCLSRVEAPQQGRHAPPAGLQLSINNASLPERVCDHPGLLTWYVYVALQALESHASRLPGTARRHWSLLCERDCLAAFLQHLAAGSKADKDLLSSMIEVSPGAPCFDFLS